MADDELFQSWEAMGNAKFEETIAKNQNHIKKYCIQLHQDDNSSILNQNSPPLGKGSPVTLKFIESRSSQSINNPTSNGTEYVLSFLETRAQRQKKDQPLSITKQVKAKKVVNRELKALSRRSKSSVQS